MSGSLARGISDLQYSGLYLPIFSVLYLYYNLDIPYHFIIFDIHILRIDATMFQAIFAITLLGSIISHGMYLSIHGHDGPFKNPKNKWTVVYQMLALAVFREPGKRPHSLDEVEEKVENILNTISNTVDRFLNSGILGKSIILWKFIKNVMRISTIITVRPIYRIISYLSLIPLYSLIINGQPSYFGAVLFVAHFTFFIGVYLMNWFPSVVQPEPAEWLYVPEYQKSPDLYEDDEIEFQYNPSGLIENIQEDIEDIRNKPPNLDDVEYLIPIDDDPEYLVEIEDSDQESE